MVQQIEIQLPAYSRGYHLVTEILMARIPELPAAGILHVFIQHTSAGLTINENADPSVRVDFESVFNRIVPENQPYYTHTMEGSDDMPSHIKASLVGASVSIPITNHRLNLGIWQGIYLCEFRDYAGPRNLLITVFA